MIDRLSSACTESAKFTDFEERHGDWVGVGFDRVVTLRSYQGHLKVTGKSNQLKIGENR